jgi:cytidyltransferase-like protein
MERLVLTVGTFDVTHLGHAIFLQQAAKLGKLIVGVNSDDYVARYKGKKPIFDLSERLNLVNLLDCVYGTVVNHQDDLEELLLDVKPDFLVIGSDWGDKYFKQIGLDRFQLKELGVTLVYLPYTPYISSTMLKERLK